MRERLVRRVIVGVQELTARQRRPVHAAAERQAQVTQHLQGLLAGNSGVVGEAQFVRLLVVQIDHRAVREEQPRGLADGLLQKLGVVVRGQRAPIMLWSTAQRAACVRDARPSLPRMLLTWVRAVRSVIDSCAAISLLAAPLATSCRTSISRGVSGSASASSLRARRRWARTRATCGSRWTSPARAARMALATSSAPASFSR